MPYGQCPHNEKVICSNSNMKECCKRCNIYRLKLKRQRQIRRTKVKREKEKKK
jgi:hypothetical protein